MDDEPSFSGSDLDDESPRSSLLDVLANASVSKAHQAGIWWPRPALDDLAQAVKSAALTRFRQKRIDRANRPKNVRYKSRKKIADNRPRVKGRFVQTAEPVRSTDEQGQGQARALADRDAAARRQEQEEQEEVQVHRHTNSGRARRQKESVRRLQ